MHDQSYGNVRPSKGHILLEGVALQPNVSSGTRMQKHEPAEPHALGRIVKAYLEEREAQTYYYFDRMETSGNSIGLSCIFISYI